jgi:HK97 family phage prohead protease
METTNTVLGRVHSFTLKDFKAGTGDSRRIKGYANASTIDRGNEIVEPKAFKSSIDKYMENPIVFYNHDWDSAIGRVVDAKITSKGLLVDIEIGKGFEPADKVWAQIEQGILKAFSIGFRPTLMEFDPDEELLVIKDMELYEVSVVTIPMNRESLFEITEDRLTNIKIMDNGNFVNYKSLLPKTTPAEPTATEDVVAEEVDPVTELSAKLDELSAKVAELSEKIEAQETELLELKTLNEDQEQCLKHLTDENKNYIEQNAMLKQENRNLMVKMLFKDANIPALIRKVLN